MLRDHPSSLMRVTVSVRSTDTQKPPSETSSKAQELAGLANLTPRDNVGGHGLLPVRKAALRYGRVPTTEITPDLINRYENAVACLAVPKRKVFGIVSPRRAVRRRDRTRQT